MYQKLILSHPDIGSAMAVNLSHKLRSSQLDAATLSALFKEAYSSEPRLLEVRSAWLLTAQPLYHCC